MQNEMGQTHTNMHTGNVTPQLNHGAHEVLDGQEVLSGAITAMDQYTMLQGQVKDEELRDILGRQLQFMQQEYNTTLDCFQSGKDPAVPTKSYKMTQGNDFVYGLTQAPPKAPIQSATAINDEAISFMALNAVKGIATMKTKAALECTNPVVRRVLADSIPNCIEMAYELSIYQNKHHYYQVPQLAKNDTMQIAQSFAPATGGPTTH
ncbi:MAG TPA: spore coat protein [Chondromyces sp.]|nr:spore coat protein [Chondromyces sp.]